MDTGFQFFKLIHEDDIHQGKVGLPKEFLKKHGNNLSSPVILKVPSGATWEVELSKSGDDVLLDKGWKEFADFYSLEHGSFVIFRDEGGCHFSVIICGKNGLEIGYPCGGDDSSLSPEADGKIQACETDRNEDAICRKKVFRNSISDSSHLRNSQALEAADKFITKNPSFKSVVWLSKVKAISVSIPTSFGQEYVKADTDNMMTLQVADRMWPVKVLRYSNCHVARFCGGWPLFAAENSLKKGDVCIFELIKSSLLNVSIFRC
ncbi:B3 domain-containing transcription factor VRN1-like [Mercurialis annua]|uniref:B3 domain-containing transcription factor VRN1-like n=1 Tax=Mercurialis annua TaxID=3986 RepID=UPI00215ED055|nr:B3 domain-containing transcription factor VRN1-like [Mercurialis annua]